MDRNQATGLLVISLMILVYFYFFGGAPQKPEQVQPATQTEVQEVIQPQISEPQTIPDSVQQLMNQMQFGSLASSAEGTEKLITLENNDVRLVFTTKGGIIKEVELKDYKTYDQKPLILVTPESSNQKLLAKENGRELNLYGLFYTVDQKTENDTLRLTFTLSNENGGYIKQHYSLPKEKGYLIGYRLETQGMSNLMAGGLTLDWHSNLIATEKDPVLSRNHSTVNYYQTDEEFDGLGERSSDLKTETVNNLKWISFKQHFFTSAVIAKDKFASGVLSQEVDQSMVNVDKRVSAQLTIPASDLADGSLQLTYFYGPNNYQLLKKVTPGFGKNVYLGIAGINLINKLVVVPVFNWLEKYISSYGIIILILVLLIKIVLSPLSYQSYLSMAKMKVLKPEIDEIKERTGGDQQKFQQEQMKLYQQVGVNPLSGCVPMLLQLPILYAMFSFFPSSIELRQQSFLWADDLSTYDSVLNLPFTIPLYGSHVSLFVLLMTASTILYTWSNNQMSTAQGPMKTMTYLMPLIFMFVLNSFPAALSYYYFLSNIVTFGQQAVIRRFVNEDKIKKALEENRKKGGRKKSKFMSRLEDAMKANEEVQKQKSNPKKKR